MQFIIQPPSSPVAFHIGSYPIYYYGIIMCTAIFIGICFSSCIVYKLFSKKEYDIYLDKIPYVIIMSILGARLLYVIGSYKYYLKSPIEVLFINHGGLSIWGGILFGIISFIFFAKKYNLNTIKYLDILALTMPLCQAVGRLGNYFNQEAFGLPYNGAIKLFVSQMYRPIEYFNFEYFHPAFLYECVCNLVLFATLAMLFFKFKNLKSGSIFCLYLIGYSLIRIMVECIRIDSILNLGSIHIAHIISLIVLTIAVGIFMKINLKNNRTV